MCRLYLTTKQRELGFEHSTMCRRFPSWWCLESGSYPIHWHQHVGGTFDAAHNVNMKSSDAVAMWSCELRVHSWNNLVFFTICDLQKNDGWTRPRVTPRLPMSTHLLVKTSGPMFVIFSIQPIRLWSRFSSPCWLLYTVENVWNMWTSLYFSNDFGADNLEPAFGFPWGPWGRGSTVGNRDDQSMPLGRCKRDHPGTSNGSNWKFTSEGESKKSSGVMR